MSDQPKYFDRREGREKPLPDCSRVGCVWNADTQRCERVDLAKSIMSFLRNNTGLGFADSGDYYDNYFYDPGWGSGYDDYFLTDYGYGGSGDWGGGDYWDNFDPITGDWIGGNSFADDGSSFWDNFDPVTGDWLSGGSDEYTYWDNFDPVTGDWIGSGDTYQIGDTFAPAPLPEGQSENWWDFLSPFLPSVDDWNWDYGQAPAPPDAGSTNPRLPGYCPGGTYHPASNPYACVPFPPNDPRAKQQAQNKPASQQPKASQSQRPQQQQCPPGQVRNPQTGQCVKAPASCPQGQVRNPNTGQCVAIPKCPQGQTFDPAKGRCWIAGTDQALDSLKGIPWWMWALLAGGAYMATRDEKPETATRRGKKQ